MVRYSGGCLLGNRRVISSGEGVCCDILLSWHMEYSEAKHHCFKFEVEQAWVVNVLQVLVFSKDGNERLVIKCEDEVVKAQDKELALEEAMKSSQCFTLYGLVS